MIFFFHSLFLSKYKFEVMVVINRHYYDWEFIIIIFVYETIYFII